VRLLKARQVEPPVALDRAVVQLGQRAALAAQRVQQERVRLQVLRELLLVQSLLLVRLSQAQA
jgi:hypothetical protein